MKRQIASSKNRRHGGDAGRPRSPEVDRAIHQAALKLFIEKGFEGVTLEKVAEHAGVARTTVYRRWTSKEALIADAIIVERGEPERSLARGAAISTDSTGRMLDALVNVWTSPNYLKIVARLIGSVPEHPKLMSIYWDTYLVPRRHAVVQVLERFRDQGLIAKTADIDILLDLIAGAVTYHLLVRPGRPSPREFRAYLLKVIHELGVDKAFSDSHEKRDTFGGGQRNQSKSRNTQKL